MILSPRIVPNDFGYCYASDIARAWHDGQLRRAWGLGPRISSGQTKDGQLWKSWDRMPELTPDLIGEMEASGVHHPASYADAYHQIAPATPRLKHTYNGLLSWWQGGPWSEALRPGWHDGQWYRYDLRSAYLWASKELPHTGTFRVQWHRQPRDVSGLWVADIDARLDLPTAFRKGGRVVISSEELNVYDLNARVYRGVTWSQALPATHVTDVIAKLPERIRKPASRAFWGRWIARDPVRCFTAARVWDLPNRTANFVWGWLIVGRVRARVWSQSEGAAHVYVDEVLTPRQLET